MGHPSKLPSIERHSFFSPHQYSERGRRLRDERERKKREFTTTYYDYIYDNAGNCRAVVHHYEEDV